MRISDWSSDVCSSDLHRRAFVGILDTVVVFVLVVLVIVLRRDRQDDAAVDIALDRQRRAASEQVVGVELRRIVGGVGITIAGRGIVAQLGRAAGRGRVCQYV